MEAMHLALCYMAFFSRYNVRFNSIKSPKLTASKDVYHSGDGGIYSEMIQNRAFQGTAVNQNTGSFQTLQYWHTSGSDTLTLDNDVPILTSALPWHMRVDVAKDATGLTGFWNEGYWGMNITTATRYAASFYLRGAYKGAILCAFWSNTTDSMLGSTTFTVDQTEADGWVPYAQTFTTTASAVDEKNTFHLDFDGDSTAGTSLRFQMISVFQQTYKNSNNGLRMDLAEALNEIGGKFLRMPGGNNLEGLSAPYQWKWNETIGPIINRPGRPGTWGYVNTDGLGLLEMMQVYSISQLNSEISSLTLKLLVVSRYGTRNRPCDMGWTLS